MSEIVFPQLPGLAWGTTKIPTWSSRVQRSVSGERQAVSYASYPIYKYTISFNVLREYASYTDLEQLQGFFNQMKGMVDTFKFVDPADAAVVTAQAIGVGNSSAVDFQLVRSYGGFVEPVFTPNVITSLRKNAVAQANPANYTVLPNGIIRFGTAPTAGQVIDWTGTFYQRCAFTQDTLELINTDGLDIWKTGKISFETVKA